MSDRRFRPPRRPAGFSALGPPPAGDGGTADLGPGPDEDLSYLSGDWRIFQPRSGHRWSLDDLVTAWVASQLVASRPPPEFIDLGTGLGSVLMLIAWAFPEIRGWGVEAQLSRAERARRSLRFNGASERVQVLDGDLRDVSALADSLPRSTLITGTPPYFDASATRAALDTETAACRVEMRGGLEVYLDAGSQLLGEDGFLVLCYPTGHGERARAAGAARGLSLAQRWTVTPRADKPPLIVVDVFRRAPTPAEVRSLVVREENGSWSEDFRAVRRFFGMPDRAPSTAPT